MSAALLLIDIQNDYFPGGTMTLVDMDAAAANAARLLARWRERGQPVFHVQHVSTRPGATFFLPDTDGVAFHSSVVPDNGEPVVVKHFPNAFRGTDLNGWLKADGVSDLVVCGAMTHMCIDGTTRAAFDAGYRCTVVEDACATRDLEHHGERIPAHMVHSAFLAALAVPYAHIVPAQSVLDDD